MEFKYYDVVTHPDSSAIKTVYYNNDTREMFVEFPNGTVAGYSDVEPMAHGDLIHSLSVGSHYSRYIRGVKHGINGDVNLVKRPVFETEEAVSSPTYEVTVQIEGRLKFKVSAQSITGAVDNVKHLVDSALDTGWYDVINAQLTSEK